MLAASDPTPLGAAKMARRALIHPVERGAFTFVPLVAIWRYAAAPGGGVDEPQTDGARQSRMPQIVSSLPCLLRYVAFDAFVPCRASI